MARFVITNLVGPLSELNRCARISDADTLWPNRFHQRLCAIAGITSACLAPSRLIPEAHRAASYGGVSAAVRVRL